MLIRVLHVEDDPDIREIVRISLDYSGKFQLVQCDGGVEALNIVAGSAFDLFLLDLMMPQMSGEELLVTLRTQPDLRKVPTVFMTAKGHAADVERLLALGAEAVIVKPFDPLTLGDQIIECLSKD